MEYYQRFTELLAIEEGEEIIEKPTYLVRASAEMIATRLGLYEDLGFSPGELAKLLLALESLNPAQKDSIRIALKRSRAVENAGNYLKEGYAL